MIDVSESVWIFDNACITCRNGENNVVVVFENVDNVFVGKLWDIPMDLFGKITELEYGERVIADIVKNAENEIPGN